MELLPSLSPRDQANVLLELLQYIEPKKKEATEELPIEVEFTESEQETSELLLAVKS